uniref:Transposase IS30-like HTH domain-containing protein n=1 Tax=Rhodococcus sp. NS1 TaxID=402236 RepID=A0A097SQK4_9NOCA|nr:hypothetical protein LRS1606.370 [Rhodococcus sp. NS1]
MGKKVPWSQRAAVYGHLIRGRSASQVSETFQMGLSTVARWADRAGIEVSLGRAGGAQVVPLDADPPRTPGRSYRRWTLADRSFIQAALSLPDPMSYRDIATELGVAPSTVSREIKVHSIIDWGQSHYVAEIAHYRALVQRPRRRDGKLAELIRALTPVLGHAETSICWGSEMIFSHVTKELLGGVPAPSRRVVRVHARRDDPRYRR